ncbi:hypothetical protein Tco_0904485 [Tanacetum coccineum]
MLLVNQPTEEVSSKTAPSACKKKVLTTGNSSKKRGKTNSSTSGNDIFSLSNSFEALNVDNPVTEEVDSGYKAFTSGVQEEGQNFTHGKCELVDDDGKPLENIDYSGDNDGEDEVEPVENEIGNYGNVDFDYDSYDEDIYEGREIPDNIQPIYDNLDIKVHGRKKK